MSLFVLEEKKVVWYTHGMVSAILHRLICSSKTNPWYKRIIFIENIDCDFGGRRYFRSNVYKWTQELAVNFTPLPWGGQAFKCWFYLTQQQVQGRLGSYVINRGILKGSQATLGSLGFGSPWNTLFSYLYTLNLKNHCYVISSSYVQ